MKATTSFLFIIMLTLIAACESGGKGKTVEIGPRESFQSTLTVNPLSANYNPLPSYITFTLPSEIDMSTVSMDDIKVTGTGTCPLSPAISSSNVGHVTTVLIDVVGCTHQSQIKVVVSWEGISNMSGARGMGTQEEIFTLNTDSASSPSLNLTSGSFNHFPGTFSILFNSSIDMATVTANMFTISGTGSCPQHPYTGLVINGHEATISYDATGCLNGDSVNISIDNSYIVDTSNRRGVGVLTRNLTLDTVGVDSSELSLNVNSGDINPLPTSVILTLPADVSMDSISLTDFIVTGSGSCASSILTGITKVGSTVELDLNPASCVNGDQLDFLLPLANILDIAGNPGTGSLSTNWRLVNLAPSIPSISIDSGIVANLATQMNFDFTNMIDMSSVSASDFTITSTGSCPTPVVTQFAIVDRQARLNLSSASCSTGDSIELQLDMSGINNTVGMSGSGVITRTFTFDKSGPLSPVFNVDSGLFSALPTTVRLDFGADTDMSTVNSSSISITGSGSCPINALSSVSISGTEAIVSLNSTGCINNDVVNFSVNMSLIKDLVGNFGVGSISKNLTLNNNVPSAPSISFVSGPMRTLPTVLDFNFDSSINMASVDLADFTLQGSGNCDPNPLDHITKTGNLVQVYLDAASCTNGDKVIVTLNMAGIVTNTSIAGAGIFRNTFTLDNQGPALPVISSAGGTSATLPTSLTFDFPADTNMTTVTQGDFSAIGCSGASVTGITKNQFSATVTIDASSCVSTNQLTVKALMSGVEDLLGNPGVGEAAVSFTLDTDGPALPAITPASATVANFPAMLSVNFSTDTLMSSVTLTDFSILGTNSCVATLSNLLISGRTATLSLASVGCVHADVLTLSVNGSSITDAYGNVGSGAVSSSWTLQRQGVNVSAVTFSLASATVAHIPTTLAVTFPSGIDMNSVDSADFFSTVNGSCPASAITSVTKSGNVANVLLTSTGCANGNIISVGLNMAGVTDSYGNAGTGSRSISFTIDTQGPAAAVANVLTSTVKVLPTSINVTFTSDTDMNSVALEDFTAVGSGTCALNALTGISKSGQVATLSLNPSACSNTNTISFNILMSKVTDSLGNAGTGTVSYVYTLDNVGPAHPTSNPASGTVGLLPTDVVLTFTGDIDMSTVAMSDLSVETAGLCGSATLSNFNKVGKTVSVRITTGCVLGTVKLKANMTDIFDSVGNPGIGEFSVTWLRIL